GEEGSPARVKKTPTLAFEIASYCCPMEPHFTSGSKAITKKYIPANFGLAGIQGNSVRVEKIPPLAFAIVSDHCPEQAHPSHRQETICEQDPTTNLDPIDVQGIPILLVLLEKRPTTANELTVDRRCNQRHSTCRLESFAERNATLDNQTIASQEANMAPLKIQPPGSGITQIDAVINGALYQSKRKGHRHRIDVQCASDVGG